MRMREYDYRGQTYVHYTHEDGTTEVGTEDDGVAVFPPPVWEWMVGNVSAPPVSEPTPVRQAIDRPLDQRFVAALLRSHPLEYSPKPGETYKRCPSCEQWSPCDVRLWIESMSKPTVNVLIQRAMITAKYLRSGYGGQLENAELLEALVHALLDAKEPVPDPPIRHPVMCPDGGTCHHKCTGGCWRVHNCGPLSGVYVGDDWPQTLRFVPNDGKL